MLHGHSMSALVSALFAARQPERVARLVLTSPALPARPGSAALRVGLAPRAAPGAAAGSASRCAPASDCKAAQWRRWRDDPTDPQADRSRWPAWGPTPPRISPALLSLIDEEIERYRVPWRIDGALQAAVSTLAAMTVDEGMVRAELERIEAPTLVVWGDQDRFIPRRLVDELMELHPGWTFRAVDGIGHLAAVGGAADVRRARCRLDGRPDRTRLRPR